jgi:type VI secretion system protein ImpK
MADTDDPFSRPEPTVLRPRPGAGRRGQPEARPQPPQAAFGDLEALGPETRELVGMGLNPLVAAASPLLLLAGRLRGSLSPTMDVTGLRRYALDEIHRFEERARSSGVSGDMVTAARYVLCAALDEAVLSTPWGSQSEWAQHPLLVALHRETWGGEKFFEMLGRVSLDPGKYIDLMELQYVCLAFGFAGKYQVMDRGHEQLASVQQTLYRKIRQHRNPPGDELSLRWRGLEDRRNPVIRYVPWWVVGAFALAVLALTFTVFYAGLARRTAPVHAELARIGLDDFTAPAAEVRATGPTLKQLLAPEEQRGVLSAEEQSGRTVVTLLARNLFASGSATIGPGHDETIRRIALALNQVPGRVLVVGHTDDQPVRSLNYQDNFELSRERAVSVVRALELTIDNKARVSFTGVGSSEPRYQPESTPENRARNRRVEIVHVRGR